VAGLPLVVSKVTLWLAIKKTLLRMQGAVIPCHAVLVGDDQLVCKPNEATSSDAKLCRRVGGYMPIVWCQACNSAGWRRGEGSGMRRGEACVACFFLHEECQPLSKHTSREHDTVHEMSGCSTTPWRRAGRGTYQCCRVAAVCPEASTTPSAA